MQALTAGESLPAPADQGLRRPARRTAAAGTRFTEMATPWTVERYEELRRAGLSREISVETHTRTIDRWMSEHGLVLETMRRDKVKALSLFLARAGAPEGSQVPDGLDPDQLVTMDEAVALPPTPSESTLKWRSRRPGTPPAG